MAKGINLSIASDTRDFQKGVKSGIIEPLEDAEDALKDIARAGERSGDDLEASLKGQQRATEELRKDYDRLGKEIDQAGRKGGDSLGGGFKKGAKEAGEATGAFKDEAVSNLSEVASSFDGSADSITDLFQGTLGGIITELGPLGLAAGTAAAVGIGLIGQAFSQSGEDAEAFQGRVDTMTGEILDNFYETGDAVNAVDDALRQWASDSERYGVALSDLRKDLKGTNLEFADMATTLAGGTTKELRKAKEAAEDQIDAERKRAAMVDTTAGADRSAARAANDKADALNKDLLPAIDQQIKANENAKLAEEALAGAQGMTIDQYKAWVEANNAATEASEASASSLTGELTAAAESTSDALDNSVIDPSKYIEGLNQRTAAVQQYQQNVQAIGEQLPDDLFNFVREQGPGFSNEIATYLSATPAQKKQIEAGWAIDAQVKGDTSDLDKKTDAKGKETKKGPTSKVQGDTKDLDKKVKEKGEEKAKGPTSKIQADDSAVDKAISALKKKTFNGPTAVFQVDRSSVNTAIANLRNTTINIKVKAVDG